METKTLRRYTLENINDIIFQGFNYELPDETLKSISEIALQVGSPDYVKTPIFQKRENPMKSDPLASLSSSSSSYSSSKDSSGGKKKRGNKNHDSINDDWESVRLFQATKIEEKNGIDADIDAIRGCINKLTDKNYSDMRDNIMDIIDKMISENISTDNLTRVSLTLFEMASNNRFYSKTYADLYSELSTKYAVMENTFKNNLDKFTGLFETIEYVDPNVNYDRFCEVNKINEKRKSLATFYLNLMNNGIIDREKIVGITRNLLYQIYTFIQVENKKNEVDELTENLAILYKKGLYEGNNFAYELIDEMTINEVVNKIANSKVKDYKSLINKSLFKFMDLVDM